MSRILRRPMFRGGRVAKASGGISQLRQGYNTGERVLSIYDQIQKQLPMPEKREPKGLSTGDYLRIASAGLDILGAPSEGSGFKGALASASGPLSKLGVDLGSSIDAREQKALETYQKELDDRRELAGSLTGAGIEFDISEMKSKGELETKKEYLDKVYTAKRNAIKGDPDESEKLKQIDADYQKDFELFIVKGFDLSDLARIGSQDEVQRKAFNAAKKELARTTNKATGQKWTEDDVGYQMALINLAGTYVSVFSESVTSSFAEGGLAEVSDVNIATATPTGATDVNVEQIKEDPASQNQPVQISYDELRARLPKEIGDDIVNLLANSYEALADFAQIQTQADIDTFNVKYGVELVLPQEV
jgi:hypothetical protein